MFFSEKTQHFNQFNLSSRHMSHAAYGYYSVSQTHQFGLHYIVL